MPTGAGKTTVFSEVLKGTYASGKSGIMVVRGRQLVDQAHKKLVRENVPHGVLMAGHWNYRPRERIQICSIDTLIARRGSMEWPKADIVVVDEADDATSPGYLQLAAHYQDSFFLPVTATPYVPKSLRHVADVCVCPIPIQELIDRGFLIAANYFVPGEPDLKGVTIRNGDYVSSELETVMNKKSLVGDAVDQWKKLADNRRSIYFCVSVAHSQAVAQLFRDAGVPAAHCDADTSQTERESLIGKLTTGELRVLCNVGILCRGVDIPPVSCIGMLRPTESYRLFIQQAGRGTRPVYADSYPLTSDQERLEAISASDKRDFIIIDHAGNVRKHGFITEEPEFDLNGKIKKFLPQASPKICADCFAAFFGMACPFCGWAPKKIERTRELLHVDGELVKLENESEETKYFRTLERSQKMYGYHRGWIFHRMKEKFNEEVARRFCPAHARNPWRGR